MGERTVSRKPYVKITEQPCSKGLRFRYHSESRSTIIMGVRSRRGKLSYPTIQIFNHKGPASVVVSCVTKDEPYKPHPYKITGKAPEIREGIYYAKVSAGQSIISFPNLGIRCIKKIDIAKSLTERERSKVDPFKTGFKHKKLPDEIDLSCIRLCFQVFLEGKVPGVFNVPLDPVVSVPVYDKKTAFELAICWISHCSAPVSGGTVICLLCERVMKGDIEVRFFNPHNSWEAFAEFTPPKLHKQHAIVFKTPKYITQDINEPVQVLVQLKRPSDGEVSVPIPFQYIPIECASSDGFKAKRQKCRESPRDLVMRHLQADKNANKNVKANAFPSANAEPWELPATTMHNPNIIETPINSTPYDQVNVSSEIPLTSDLMATEFADACHNTQTMMTMFDQTTEDFMLNNHSMEYLMNCKNNNVNYDQQYSKSVYEQGIQHNTSYLDDLITALMT